MKDAVSLLLVFKQLGKCYAFSLDSFKIKLAMIVTGSKSCFSCKPDSSWIGLVALE